MIDKKQIQDTIEQHIAGTDKFIVDIKIGAGNVIEVILDSDTTVTIDDCVAASRAVDGSLDRETEDFELTVYSAGLSEPLKLVRQYNKHKGSEIEVILKTGIKVKGVLSGVSDNDFELTYKVKELPEGKKRKEWVEKNARYAYDEVKSTKLIINFK